MIATMMALLMLPVQDAGGAPVPKAIAPQVVRYSDCFVEEYDKIRPAMMPAPRLPRVRAAFAACASVKVDAMNQSERLLAALPAYSDPSRRRNAIVTAFDGYEQVEIASATKSDEAPPARRNIGSSSNTRLLATFSFPSELMPVVKPYIMCRIGDGSRRSRAPNCTRVRKAVAGNLDHALLGSGVSDAAERNARVEATLAEIDRIDGEGVPMPPPPRAARPILAEIYNAYAPYMECRLKGRELAPRNGLPTYQSRTALECADTKSQSRKRADAALMASGHSDVAARNKLLDEGEIEIDAQFPGVGR
ncbi:hypothetical protein P1X14_00385 [Sphingomonas sp. AOB5]|uniref:hypothetical protein n=1 Tax=Sphingomonas sp. AOB5 TaxID=3034017 RepID=UPI0023F9D3FD|nr:hypothetical protein [Sphingomonas sp. AOB5]MDF7773688.1 hypothetical protein [Sphingomonas sp. AOB5]